MKIAPVFLSWEALLDYASKAAESDAIVLMTGIFEAKMLNARACLCSLIPSLSGRWSACNEVTSCADWS